MIQHVWSKKCMSVCEGAREGEAGCVLGTEEFDQGLLK